MLKENFFFFNWNLATMENRRKYHIKNEVKTTHEQLLNMFWHVRAHTRAKISISLDVLVKNIIQEGTVTSELRKDKLLVGPTRRLEKKQFYGSSN